MKHVNKLIREIAPVIVGILIALFINNWNEDRKEKKYLDQIFSSIEKELEESLLEIQEVIPKQLASADTLQAYMNDDDVSLYSILMKSNGIHMPRIRTNSWNAISNTRINLVEYDKLSALADIEDRKINLYNRVEKQLEFTFQNFEETGTSKKQILNMILLDVVGAEQRLLAKIEEFLENETEAP